jgi:hypothetical protein
LSFQLERSEYSGEKYSPDDLPDREAMRNALTRLNCLAKFETTMQASGAASYHTRPFITSADGIYRAYLEECPLTALQEMLLSQIGVAGDYSYKVTREILSLDFRDKLKKARGNYGFVGFIRHYFDAAIKRWN